MKIKKWLEIKIYDEWPHKGKMRTRLHSETKIIRTEYDKKFMETLFKHILSFSEFKKIKGEK